MDINAKGRFVWLILINQTLEQLMMFAKRIYKLICMTYSGNYLTFNCDKFIIEIIRISMKRNDQEE